MHAFTQLPFEKRHAKMRTLITRVELDPWPDWLTHPQPLGKQAISWPSGYKKSAIWEKIAHFSMGVNVWQLSKYYNYDKNLAEHRYCTSETTLASQLLDAELQKVTDNKW